jgi:hypothetical protein
MSFIVLSSPETVHDTVQYSYCIFLLLNRLLRIRLKRQNPLLSSVREIERKYTVNVQCSVQYTLLLLYLMLVMSYCANLSIKLYRIYVRYRNITLYHVIYSFRYYPRFSVTAVGLGTYYLWIRWSTCIKYKKLYNMKWLYSCIGFLY